MAGAPDPRPWRTAWQQALYGPAGFYRRTEGPAGHFATAADGLGPAADLLAEAVLAFARRERLDAVVEIGSGRGALLTRLAARDDAATPLRLTGLDVVDRPAGLPDRVEWVRSPGGAELPPSVTGLRATLLLAHEWLDVVPCPVLEADADGVLREVLVDEAGAETLGEPVAAAAELAWLDRWWPGPHAPGDRVELGLPRDRAWADACAALDSGVALAIDYGHRRDARPRGGTLTGFRDGQEVLPVPDGSTDVTAHVAVDALDGDRCRRQGDVLRDLGLRVPRPDAAGAVGDPVGYLHALARSSASATLGSGALGDFWWVETTRRLR